MIFFPLHVPAYVGGPQSPVRSGRCWMWKLCVPSLIGHGQPPDRKPSCRRTQSSTTAALQIVFCSYRRWCGPGKCLFLARRTAETETDTGGFVFAHCRIVYDLHGARRQRGRKWRYKSHLGRYLKRNKNKGLGLHSSCTKSYLIIDPYCLGKRLKLGAISE